MALASSVLMPTLAHADLPLVTILQTLSATGTIRSPMLTGQTQCSVTITGTWTGTATFEASSDYGASYTAIPGTAKGATTSATTTTVNGVFVVPISSDEFFRISWARSSGSLTAYISCADGTSPSIGAVTIANPGSFPTPIPLPTQPYQVVGVGTSASPSAGALTVVRPDTGATGQSLPLNTNASPVTVAIPPGNGSLVWTITGLTGHSATVQFQVSADGGATWGSTTALNEGTNGASGATSTDGVFNIAVGGHTNARLFVLITGTANTATVAYNISSSVGVVSVAGDNVTQFGGNALVTGTGASGAGIPRMTVANDSTIGLIAGTQIVGKVGIDQTTPGTTNGVLINNWSGFLHPSLSNQTTAQVLQAGALGKKTYIYAYSIRFAGTSPVVQFVEGTGSNCGTGLVNISSRFTANFGGAALTYGAYSEVAPFPILQTATNGDDLCVIVGGTVTEYDVDATVGQT